MKFINYLEQISGVSIYAMTSFVLFSSFFVLMLIWVLKADKSYMDEVSRIPLDKKP